MSHSRLPPLDPEACLVRLRPSTQKGGTLIAEEVTDWATHDRRIGHPDGYRPARCPTCGARRLHVHDYRERQLRADPDTPVATIVRHACVACAAIWQVLPAFIARHLWRTWDVVAQTVTGAARPATGLRRGPPIPPRTRAPLVRAVAAARARAGPDPGGLRRGRVGRTRRAAAACRDVRGSGHRVCRPDWPVDRPAPGRGRRAPVSAAAEGPSHVTHGPSPGRAGRPRRR
jgi:hypothetical protein